MPDACQLAWSDLHNGASKPGRAVRLLMFRMSGLQIAEFHAALARFMSRQAAPCFCCDQTGIATLFWQLVGFAVEWTARHAAQGCFCAQACAAVRGQGHGRHAHVLLPWLEGAARWQSRDHSTGRHGPCAPRLSHPAQSLHPELPCPGDVSASHCRLTFIDSHMLHLQSSLVQTARQLCLGLWPLTPDSATQPTVLDSICKPCHLCSSGTPMLNKNSLSHTAHCALQVSCRRLCIRKGLDPPNQS